MDDAFLIRDLPDGSSQFVLDDPVLRSLRIDEWTTLDFGRTDLSIRAPFTLSTDGDTYPLDPQHRSALGPLMALYLSTLLWLWVSPLGELSAVFVDGSTLTVPQHPVSRAWSVGDVSYLSGGTG